MTATDPAIRAFAHSLRAFGDDEQSDPSFLDLRRRTTDEVTRSSLIGSLDRLAPDDRTFLRKAIKTPCTRWTRSTAEAKRARRRARRLTTRILQPRARMVMHYGDQLFNVADFMLARDRYVEGHSLRSLAFRHELTLWQVRTKMTRIDERLDRMWEAVTRGRR